MIVDSDQTASQILEIMNRKKMPGEVTFLPLNKLRTPPVNYPDHTVRIQKGLVCVCVCVNVCMCVNVCV